MKAYHKQVKILTAIGLVLIAAVFLMVAFTPLGGQRVFSNKKAPQAAVQAVEQSGKININTATAEELQLLPGISKSIAADIVNFRKVNGAFRTPEELMLIDGIGQKSFERIKDYICI